MSFTARNVLFLVGSVALAFTAGSVSGYYVANRFYTPPHEEDSHVADAEADHIALTQQAYQNLGLRMGKIRLREYWKTVTIPGEVIEIPGESDVSISAPVMGVVEEVMVRSGQALSPNDRLFKLRITDQDLTTMQTKLLSLLSRQDVLQKEIDRLAPLTESGTVSGRRKRDLEYELSQLVSERATLVQGVRARGLPDDAIESIIQSGDLATTLTLSVPQTHPGADSEHTKPVSLGAEEPGAYSVENLQVHPGKSVRQGDELCSLAYHKELYLRGHAFESDLQNLNKMASNDWPITAEFGHEHEDDHTGVMLVEGLRLLHVDNHVDRETQTFSFYLPLKNRVSQALTDDQGRTFRQWLFKPGQLAHIRVPIEKWEQQFVLPAGAVVVEGPNAFVFRELAEHSSHDSHSHDSHSDDSHSHGPHSDDEHQHGPHDHSHPPFIELELVPVRLLHRDDQTAIVSNDGQLAVGERVALNSAYKLRMAMKMQAGGGTSHHGHSH